jgi:hypothetical protein
VRSGPSWLPAAHIQPSAAEPTSSRRHLIAAPLVSLARIREPRTDSSSVALRCETSRSTDWPAAAPSATPRPGATAPPPARDPYAQAPPAPPATDPRTASGRALPPRRAAGSPATARSVAVHPHRRHAPFAVARTCTRSIRSTDRAGWSATSSSINWSRDTTRSRCTTTAREAAAASARQPLPAHRTSNGPKIRNSRCAPTVPAHKSLATLHRLPVDPPRWPAG